MIISLCPVIKQTTLLESSPTFLLTIKPITRIKLLSNPLKNACGSKWRLQAINAGWPSKYQERLRECVDRRQKMLDWSEQNIKLDNKQFINKRTLFQIQIFNTLARKQHAARMALRNLEKMEAYAKWNSNARTFIKDNIRRGQKARGLVILESIKPENPLDNYVPPEYLEGIKFIIVVVTYWKMRSY